MAGKHEENAARAHSSTGGFQPFLLYPAVFNGPRSPKFTDAGRRSKPSFASERMGLASVCMAYTARSLIELFSR